MRSKRQLALAAALAAAVLAQPTLAAAATNVTVVPYTSTWKVLDNGTNQTPAALPSASHFADPSYVESGSWHAETIQANKVLGYGDNTRTNFPTQTPNLSFGPSSTNKYITTYFRQIFNVADASSVASLTLNIRRDDGVVVFLNGTEVGRSNMSAGAYTYTTFAPTIIDSAAEYTPVTLSIPANLLLTGQNLLAIELHQRDGTSSDITFAAELIAAVEEAAVPEVPSGLLLAGTAAAGLTLVATIRRRLAHA